MTRGERQAYGLNGVGLGATVVALCVPQLWPHVPWYLWQVILWVGLGSIVVGVTILLSLHLSRRQWACGIFGVLLFGIASAGWYYKNLPDKTPLSLLELYITDFPDYYCLRTNLDEANTSGSHLKIIAAKCRNYYVNAYFYTIFIPDVPLAFSFAAALPNQFQRVIANQLSNPIQKLRVPGDLSSTPDADLIFTGRVYIYTESDFNPAEIGDLYKLYRNTNLFVQFRGFGYRTAHWKDYDRRANNVLRQFKKENSDMFR